MILEVADDIQVVGAAQEGAAAQRLVAALAPDILLLDFVMPGNHDLAVARWTRQHYPHTLTLVLTAHDRDAFLAQALECQVAGYLLKADAPYQLVTAIRRAAQGECLITGEQLARAQRWRHTVTARWDSLTARQREVLTLLAQGRRNQEIAQELHIARRTVETHIQNILRKLELASTRAAVAWVWAHDLLAKADLST